MEKASSGENSQKKKKQGNNIDFQRNRKVRDPDRLFRTGFTGSKAGNKGGYVQAPSLQTYSLSAAAAPRERP